MVDRSVVHSLTSCLITLHFADLKPVGLKRFACKSIDCSLDGVLLGLVQRELATWTAVGKEKFITKYHDCSWAKSTSTVRIYMTLYEGGDLQGVIDVARSQGSAVHPIIATACASQISRGVQTCHTRNIIHRDLKPANVLLSAPFECNNLLWKATNEGTSLTSSERHEAETFVKNILRDSAWCHISDFGLSKFSSHILSNAHQTIATFSMMGTPAFMAPVR
jgi:serine/threonine protein kinase